MHNTPDIIILHRYCSSRSCAGIENTDDRIGLHTGGAHISAGGGTQLVIIYVDGHSRSCRVIDAPHRTTRYNRNAIERIISDIERCGRITGGV